MKYLYTCIVFFFVIEIFAQSNLNNLSRDPADQIRDALKQIKLQADQEKERKEAEKEKLKKQKKVDRSKEIVPKEGDPSFLVEDIEIHDVTLLKFEDIKKVTGKYEGTKFNLPRINALMQDLTQAYIDHGYITSRIYIKPQNILDGSLELYSLEGKIEEIIVAENDLGDRIKGFMAFPIKKGEFLELKKVEQGLDQLNRVASLDAKMKIKPGKLEGHSVVHIVGEPKDELRFNISIDNFGTELTGEYRATLALEWDNLLNINESWAFLYLGSYDTNAFVSSVSFPFRWWTFSTSFSYSEYLADINIFAELLGQSYTASLDANRVIFRNAHHKTFMGMGVDFKRSERSINDAELDPQELADIRLYVNHLWRKPKRVITTSFSYIRGLPIRDQIDGDSDQIPQQEFNMLSLNAGLLEVFKPNLVLQSSLKLQYAFEALQGSEQVFVGDYYGVRGFSGSGVGGDWGGYNRNELIYTIPKKFNESKLFFLKWIKEIKPYVFFDVGYAKSKASDSDAWISGGGLGVRMKWGKFSVDVYGVAPIVYSSDIDPQDDVKLYVSGTLKVF